MPGNGHEELKELTDHDCRLLVTVIHMPVDVACNALDIKEVFKGWGEMFLIMEIAKIALKGRLVVIDGALTLTKLGRSSWDERSGCPGLKRGKGCLEVWRPFVIEQVLRMVL